MDKIQSIHQDIQNETNIAALASLKTGMKKIKDSLNHLTTPVSTNISWDTTGRSILVSQLQKYQQLIGEYQLMVDSKPVSLLAVEKARAALYPDKPRRREILIATAILSLFFAFAVALLLEKRKTSPL
jgi:hypothetical protein